jgi:hypothetical protein
MLQLTLGMVSSIVETRSSRLSVESPSKAGQHRSEKKVAKYDFQKCKCESAFWHKSNMCWLCYCSRFCTFPILSTKVGGPQISFASRKSANLRTSFFRFADLPQMWQFADLQFADWHTSKSPSICGFVIFNLTKKFLCPPMVAEFVGSSALTFTVVVKLSLYGG